jgi:energy-coupling factor transporter transmembrane protein EcfT
MKYVNKAINLFAVPLLVIALAIVIGFLFHRILIPAQYTLLFICIIFLLSLIAIIIKRKWLKFFLSLFGYFVFLFILIFFYGMNQLSNQSIRPEIVNDEFYSNEILECTDLVLPEKLTMIAKIDTIHYIGPGGGDYEAGCIFQGSQENISKIQKSISRNKKFKLVKEEVTLPESFSFVSKTPQKNMSFTSVYKYENEGCCNFEFAFDKTKTRMYFYEFFY